MDKNDARNLHRGWEQTNLIHRLCHALEIASLTVEHLVPAGFTDLKNPSASIRPENPSPKQRCCFMAQLRPSLTRK